MNENETILVAAFADGAAAEAAVESLREWDKRVRDVKLGVIGTVHYEDGGIKSKVVHGGIFNRKMPITDEGVRALGRELSGGQVAVVVACDDFEATMVSDSLTRDGGRILASNYERTKEEITAENQAVEEALEEKAMQEAARRAPRNADRNVARPQ
jgi:hypothetical protein